MSFGLESFEAQYETLCLLAIYMALLYIYFLIVKDLLLVTKQSGKPADSLLNPNISSQKKTSEILYGAENAVGRGVQFMQNVKKKMDIFFDHKAPSIVI